MHKKLFEMSKDLLCIANSDGYFIDINPAFSKLLGYDREEILSKSITEFLHPEDIEKTSRELEKIIQGKSVENFENRYLHKNGVEYKVLLWTSNFDTESGLFFGSARDITDLRHKEIQLESLNKTLFDHLIIAFTDSYGIITDVNERFCKVSGYSREELIGKNHNILSSGHHPKSFWEKLWKTITIGKTWSGHIINRKKTGELYHVYSVISPTFDDQRVINGYMAIRIEITKEILLRKNLEKTFKILNETNAIAKVGGWELIAKTGELNWTDETFKILEVEKTDGQKPMLPQGLDLFTDEHKPIIEEAVNKGLEKGESYSLELQAKTAKGNILWVYTNGRAHYDGQKEVQRLSGTIQDINARKLTELKLEQEREKSAQNARLATLGELSAGIAHEINNPLQVIIGNLMFLEKFKDDEEIFKQKSASISKSCNRIAKITRNLVKHARKNTDEELIPTSVSKLLESAYEMGKLKAKQFHVQLSLEETNDSQILCHEIEIEQVLINLINNAIDAIKELDEKWVKLKASQLEDTILIKVIDSGAGLNQAIIENIFEPFYTTKGVGEGTGLGLSISKGIVENHNGSLSVDTSLENTCFVVKFPIYQDSI